MIWRGGGEKGEGGDRERRQRGASWMIDGSETEGMYGIQGQSVSIFSLKFTDYHHIQEESWMFGQELAPCAAEVEEPSIHLSILSIKPSRHANNSSSN